LLILDGTWLSHFCIVNFTFPYNAQRVCVWLVAGLRARIFRKKIRRSKPVTTFWLGSRLSNYFYTLLAAVIFFLF